MFKATGDTHFLIQEACYASQVSVSSKFMKFENQTKHFSHHVKVGPCFTRPAYRDGRRKTAVKVTRSFFISQVFTVADESCYLLIFGVPSLDLEHPLKEKCKQYGNVQSLVKIIDYPNKETFTDVFVVKYDNLKAARCERIPFTYL
ncbi:unnamed protein product [Schistosoma margrebowiei]|uniref:Uncharacterized protein n=1 Tax=Schistosoma margrebowiei TaxID=48269 RepID=A0A183N8I0_9TREM|nr:unnamed protein product [Schistosoma margrebowiei]